MTVSDNLTLIAIGHRARSGKDYAAKVISEIRDNVTVIHWADSLYEELENKERKFPLIKRETKGMYAVFDKMLNGRPMYKIVMSKILDDIMIKRGLFSYWGADSKDPEMMQYWGTNYRRNQEVDYWIDRTLEKIKSIDEKRSGEKHYIVIPDTRFYNEKNIVQSLGGTYINMVRIDDDGKQYYAKDRDRNHSSECNLDDAVADYTITSDSFILDKKKEDMFRSFVSKALNLIDNNSNTLAAETG